MAGMSHDTLALIFAFLVIGGLGYLKFRAAKKHSEETTQEAGVTTLFDGEK
jgi:hypothetical protein